MISVSHINISFLCDQHEDAEAMVQKLLRQKHNNDDVCLHVWCIQWQLISLFH